MTLDKEVESKGVILIADDEKSNRELYGRILRTQGYDSYGIAEAGSLEEAKKAYDSQKPVLIITDNQMPRKDDGMEFIKYIREKEGEGSHTPIIMIEGKCRKGDALKAGVNYHLGKPISIVILSGYLEELLPR